jgi:hypothetical protein
MDEQITVAWFSAGVSSAVATKLMIEQVDMIIYQHIDDQHEDTMRFVKDCEVWFGKPIIIDQSPLKCVNHACRQLAYINGPKGAACTRLLKRRQRNVWESQHRFFCNFRYVWGMDLGEQDRADRLIQDMREDDHSFPLIDRRLSKSDAHGILREAGISRPMMYEMGYPNNNCVGCVKGGRGYWNKIRTDFPEKFKERAELERLLGRTCLKKERPDPTKPAGKDNSVLFYLDELDPKDGRDCKIIVPECGAMCESTMSYISEEKI